MAHGLILFVYCTKEDGAAVRQEAAVIQNINLQITASKSKLSIKRIVDKLQKSRQLWPDDYVIAIDCPEQIIFRDDSCADNVLHFTSLSSFKYWFRQQFEQ